MAVMKTKDEKEIYINCNCSCGNGCSIKLWDLFGDGKDVSISFVHQGGRPQRRLQRIWSAIRGKDFYWSEILLNEEEWKEFYSSIEKFNELINK